MKLTTKTLGVLLCLIVATPVGAEEQDREFFASTVATIFNYISRFVVPTFNEAFQDILASEFNSFNLDFRDSGSMKTRVGFCKPKLSFDYHLGIMTGLGSMGIESLKLDERTAKLSGNIWSDMTFEGAFDLATVMEDQIDLLIDVQGKMKTNICGVKYSQNVKGDLEFAGARAGIRLLFKGGFNALNLQGTVDSIELQDIDMGWDNFSWDINANSAISSAFNYQGVSFGADNALKEPLEQAIEMTKDQILPYEISIQ